METVGTSIAGDNNPRTVDSVIQTLDVYLLMSVTELPVMMETCTTGDVCGNGTCSGVPIVCNDYNPCINRFCDPYNGCIFTFNNNSCDDGNACTIDDICKNGSCVAGSPIVCNDYKLCTTDPVTHIMGVHLRLIIILVMMEMLALQVMFVTMEVAAELLLTVTMETSVH